METRTYHRWWLTDPATGKRRQTRHHMAYEDVRQRHPGAEPVPGTMEVRPVFADAVEGSTSVWLRGPILPQ